MGSLEAGEFRKCGEMKPTNITVISLSFSDVKIFVALKCNISPGYILTESNLDTLLIRSSSQRLRKVNTSCKTNCIKLMNTTL